MHEVLFPFTEFWWFYLSFTLLILVLILADLGVFHRQAHEVSLKEAGGWCAVWFIFAATFNYFLYRFALHHLTLGIDPSSPAFIQASESAQRLGLEFLTGYLVEQSLSVDNLFIFVVVFRYFAIPPMHQHRVLFFGILGAMLFRGIFIALGSQLMQLHFVHYFFGALLIITGIKILSTSEKSIEPEKNLAIRLLRRCFPVTTDYNGGNFFIKREGRTFITPLFITLVFLEITDIVFAIDSVPAIFAISREPLVIFTSNICAILGLRSMYFLLANVMDKFHVLKYGLSIILVFIGLKMALLDQLFQERFPTDWSLAFIATVMTLSIIFSIIFRRRE